MNLDFAYKILGEVDAEVTLARAMHRPFPSSDPVRCSALLSEECGEVASEALALTRPGENVVSRQVNLRAEVLQVMAVCMMWMEAIDGEHR
jgi:hypothetical protein